MSSETKLCWLADHTTALRFVEKDGKRILQQHFLGYRYGIAMESAWRDVPLVEETDDVREETAN